MRDKFNYPSLRPPFLFSLSVFLPCCILETFPQIYEKHTAYYTLEGRGDGFERNDIIRINRRAAKRIDVKRRYVENIGEGSARPER